MTKCGSGKIIPEGFGLVGSFKLMSFHLPATGRDTFHSQVIPQEEELYPWKSWSENSPRGEMWDEHTSGYNEFFLVILGDLSSTGTSDWRVLHILKVFIQSFQVTALKSRVVSSVLQVAANTLCFVQNRNFSLFKVWVVLRFSKCWAPQLRYNQIPW